MPRTAITKINIFFKYTQVFKPLGFCALITKSTKTGKTKAKAVEQKAPIREMNKCNLGTNRATQTVVEKIKVNINFVIIKS